MEKNKEIESKEHNEAPQYIVQQFSMEALHHVMMKNNSQILGMYDEMSIMYGQLDAYKHPGSRQDRAQLLDLYNGSMWSRTFKNKDTSNSKMQHTAFNMCGFIQPSFVVQMLQQKDPEAFNDRQFFICPPEVEYNYSDLKVPMDPSVPKLTELFKNIMNDHESEVCYTFGDEAHDKFIELHDKLSDRKLSIVDDEDRRGVISKGKGQLARLAMVIHCLEQALEHYTTDGEDIEWDYSISVKSVCQAAEVLDYIISQKFALMMPEIHIVDDDDNTSPLLNTGNPTIDSNPSCVSKFLSFKNRDIQSSDVSK